MITLKSYPTYKDSGVDWLGELPYEWPLVRLRSVAQLSASSVDKVSSPNELPVRLCNYTDVYYNHLITDDLKFMKGTATPDEIERFSLRGGEVLFTKDSESFDDIGIPAVADEGLENVVVGYHLMVARPSKALSGHYLAWFFSPQVNRWQFEVSAKGVTRFGMPQSGFKDALIPLPPLDEQRAIADFLDGMDARISRFIAARRKMIALLEEKKQAVINQAVTRGLDPSVPMKDSGIDWLGKIPAHWETATLRQTCRLAGGMTPTKSRVEYWRGDIPWVSPKDMKRFRIADAIDHISETAVRDTGLTMLHTGSVLIVVRGMILARKIPIAIAARTLTINQDMKALIPNNRLEPEYLAWTLTSGQEALFPLIDEAGHGTRRLPTPALMSMNIPVPPLDEQRSIIHFLNREVARIDTLISRHRREIELMQEYRTRLISDVVTGKLDARRVKLPAVEEIEAAMEDEPVEEFEEIEA